MNIPSNERLSEYYDPKTWLDEVGPAQMQQWLGHSKKCPACGRTHSIKTRQMLAAKGMAGKAAHVIRDLGIKGRCLVVMDKNTKKAAGEALVEGLGEFSARAVVFDREDLHADEQSLGTLLTAMAEKPDFLVSCGSGTLTDITRYNCYMAGIPFISYATAASVDGFASSSTPLLIRGFKATYPGVAPDAILYDPQVLASAPQKMTAAGFGDVLAKIIALIDWRLAWLVDDEGYCPLIAGLVDRAVAECLNLADDLAAAGKAASDQNALERRGKACSMLMETLSLTGIAMQMMGTSRPASGSDHQISHMLEMLDIQRKRPGSLHGDKVGIGTLIGMKMYLRLFEGNALPEQRPHMAADIWEKEVRRVYGPLAERALEINEPVPPQGKVWQEQKERIAAAMEAFGYAYIQRFKTLLPQARDMILAQDGPVRPDQLGYSRQDTYDAIAHGKENRPKFTTLRLAERFGWLYDLAEEFADGLPAGKIY